MRFGIFPRVSSVNVRLATDGAWLDIEIPYGDPKRIVVIEESGGERGEPVKKEPLLAGPLERFQD